MDLGDQGVGALTSSGVAPRSATSGSARFWKDVNARADTCTGSRCPEFEQCWLTTMRRRAEEASVVVVNHHLFFADLAVRGAYGAVIPEYDTVVFDEAHLLEEVATQYFGAQLSAAQLEELSRDAERLAARAGGGARGGGAAGLRLAVAELFLPIRERLRTAQGRVRFAPGQGGVGATSSSRPSPALRKSRGGARARVGRGRSPSIAVPGSRATLAAVVAGGTRPRAAWRSAAAETWC